MTLICTNKAAQWKYISDVLNGSKAVDLCSAITPCDMCCGVATMLNKSIVRKLLFSKMKLNAAIKYRARCVLTKQRPWAAPRRANRKYNPSLCNTPYRTKAPTADTED